MSGEEAGGASYRQTGVDTRAATTGLSRLGSWINKTLDLRAGKVGSPVRGLGYYANVLDLGNGLGLAVSCDGVGTKLLVAEAMGRYETIGIDCVAMNVNDLICVGAEPIALLDYLAVGKVEGDVLEQVGQGLYEGARRCGITIPGGELAQVAEMLRGEGATRGFDIVGTAVGLVPTGRVLFGQDVVPGDVVVGISSTGLHSNGYTLARRILAPRREDYFRYELSLGRTVGEELLEPTALYVSLALELFQQDLGLHALCHITGDGYLNLTRVESPVGFCLDSFPEPHTVFRLIEERGHVSKAEMFEVFNMGIGLCVVLPETGAEAVRIAAASHGFQACLLGQVTNEEGVVRLPQHGLVGRRGGFVRG